MDVLTALPTISYCYYLQQSSLLISFNLVYFLMQNNGREIGELVLDYHYASLEVQTDIDNAYSLLCVAQDVSLSST